MGLERGKESAHWRKTCAQEIARVYVARITSRITPVLRGSQAYGWGIGAAVREQRGTVAGRKETCMSQVRTRKRLHVGRVRAQKNSCGVWEEVAARRQGGWSRTRRRPCRIQRRIGSEGGKIAHSGMGKQRETASHGAVHVGKWQHGRGWQRREEEELEERQEENLGC